MGVVKKIRQKSFTLIEIIVVVGVIGFIVPTIFAIVFTVLKQQTKVYRLAIVKKEGDYAINLMENLIRNSVKSIHTASPPDDTNEICKAVESPSSASILYFIDNYGQWFSLQQSNNSIASSSSVLTDPVNLTSSKTIVSDLSLGCEKTALYSSPIIKLSFSICFNNGTGSCASVRPEEITNLYYQTKIKLRN